MRTIGGRQVSMAHALAFEVRKIMAYEGYPIFLKSGDIRRTTPTGWNASAAIRAPFERRPHPVSVSSPDSIEECGARGVKLKCQFLRVDKLVITVDRG